jgi:hypothetical protein
MELNANDRRVAAKLAEMASDELITYAPTGTRVAGCGRVVWYGMIATPADGKPSFEYWLRRDYGSYAGEFLTISALPA